MKNKRFITAVLVLSMMLMGAGYAAWTQDFVVTANVNTGELDIALSTDGAVVISTFIGDDTEATIDELYAEGAVVVDDTEGAYAATANLVDMYPGAIAEFEIEVTNTGTVGIELDNVGDAVNVDDEVYGMYTITAVVEDASADIPVGGTETVYYTVEFVDGANDDSENLLEGEVVLSIPVTYKQFNQ